MDWLALLLKLAHVAGALAMRSATRIEQPAAEDVALDG